MAYSSTYSFHPHPSLIQGHHPDGRHHIDDNVAGFRDALDVQSRLFPALLPAIHLLDHAHDWRTKGEVSGDYFDCFPMPGGRLALAIGEVSGGDVPAALMTPVLHGMVRSMSLSEGPPLVEVVRTIAETFARICPEGCFATLFLAEIDPLRRRLRYVNAGHEPAVLVRRTGQRGKAILLEATGPVIGMLRRFRYHERACPLTPDDVLVAMTDGICDAECATGEVWGRDHLLRVIHECEGASARTMVDEIFVALDKATAGAPMGDDRTLWLGHVRQEAEQPRRLAESVLENTGMEQLAAELVGAGA